MKKQGIYKKLLLTAVMPVLIFGIIITIVCYGRFKSIVYTQAHDSMNNIAIGVSMAYNLSYPGDYYLVKDAKDKYDLYKGEEKITMDYSIIDNFSSLSNTEISLLYKDMRIHTTLTNSVGYRLVGICANSATAHTVLEEEKAAFYDNVSILDEGYLVLYVPLRNSDASVIGMIEIAQKTASLKKGVWKAVWPVLVLAIPGMAIAAFVAYKNTKKITKVLKAIQNFLNKVATGNLQAELDTTYLKRPDELGEIARSSVAMQRSIRGSIENDPLTGLYNRRHVFFAYSRIAKKSKETGLPFTVAFTDIDFFKKVNDTYGHNAGDEVLKAVATQLKKAMQGKGVAARWGGEEFIMLFDKTNVDDALPTLEHFLDSIRDMTVHTEEGDINITMTIGVTEGFSEDIDAVIKAADNKLYYGKQHGRNQIVVNMVEE